MDERQNFYLQPIRLCVRAVILRADEVLVQVKEKPGVPQYLTLPGGKQEAGESAPDCMIRECYEEIGAQVRPIRMLGIAEVFKQKSSGVRHQMEVLYLASIDDDYIPAVGPHPDPSQVATRWAHIRDEAHLFRPAYAPVLTADQPADHLGVFYG